MFVCQPQEKCTTLFYLFFSVSEGGRDKSTSLADILRYNPTDDLWKTAGEMSEPRHKHVGALLANVSAACSSG